MNFKHIPSLIYEALKEWNDDNVSVLAAALAYYTIFSIAPMFIFLVTMASVVFRRENFRQWLFSNTGSFVGPEVLDALRSILDNIQNPPTTVIATIIGLVTLFFGTTRIVSHLRYSFNYIWKIPRKPGGGIRGTVEGRLRAFLIVIIAGFSLIVLAFASAFLSGAGAYLDRLAPRLGFVLQFTNILVSLVLGTVIFAVMFKYLPSEKIAWTDVWIGAGVTSILFALGKHLLGMYFGRGAVHSAYGAAGSLVVLILWLYYSAHILFFGVEFTQIYTRRYGSRIRRRARTHQEKLHKMHQHILKDPLE